MDSLRNRMMDLQARLESDLPFASTDRPRRLLDEVKALLPEIIAALERTEEELAGWEAGSSAWVEENEKLKSEFCTLTAERDRLRALLKDSQAEVCSFMCLSVWQIAEGQTHNRLCSAITGLEQPTESS